MNDKIKNRVQVGYTDSELAKLKLEYSKTTFSSFSKFLNYKTTNRFFITSEENFSKVFMDLSKIGRNMNQIAKAFNDVTATKYDVDFSVLEELKNTISEIKAFQKNLLSQKL